MKKETSKRTAATSKKTKIRPIQIVAIGASAGGIEAVTELLKNLPDDTGMAYVYIQHLDPTHESMLSTILARATKMNVQEASNLRIVEPNHLYVIPPNNDMSIQDGMLLLSERTITTTDHMPIDQFFVSLAEKHKENSIGIVLSGNAHDGTLGLKAIKMAGGITFAQDETAKFQSMPKSAITEGAVDLVLSPKEMADELQHIARQAVVIRELMLDASKEIVADNDEDLKAIIQILRKSTGVDFSHYKINTIRRRIVRRMFLYKLDSLKNYVQYLKQHTHEVNVLYQDMLINVTSFFRDPDSMEYMQKTLFPRILKSKSMDEPIRIWIPACSTGEEAYSVAIILMEVLGDKASSTSIQIFATDLSEPAINKARLGLYSKSDVTGVSPKRLQRFFTKVDGNYRISKVIRDLCVFAPHNLFKDPPFSRLDFISCCNLLIYLDAVLQKKVIATFYYALNSNGFLMLGKSETIGTSGQLFTQIEKKYKIYSRKRDAAARAMFEMSYHLPESDKKEIKHPKPRPQKPDAEIDLSRIVDDVLLSQFSPASVVVNNDLEILQFRGSTGLFLEPSPGKASLNLLKMAKPGLAFELRSAIHKVAKSGERTKKTGLEIKDKGITRHLSIEVLPLRSEEGELLYMVVLEEVNTPLLGEIKPSLLKDKLVKQLQDELNAVKEDMRSIIEEQEASNEELQSANEEIVSSNEELQSINEELETSKEEVESTNEELITINTELQVRNEQLAGAYDYSEAVIATIREAVLVLDQNLRVKTANRSFYRTFQLKEEETEGLLIFELGHKHWDIPQLRELLEDIIPQKTQFSGFEIKHYFPGLGEKIMLLNARQLVQKIHGQQLILIAIEDITEHKEAEKIIAEREAWLRNMADNAPVMIWVADRNKYRTFSNKTWLAYTGRTLRQEEGSGWKEDIHPDDFENYIKAYDKGFEEKKSYQSEYRLRRIDGEYRWILSTAKPTYAPEGTFTGFIGTCTEIHDQRLMNEELEKRVEERTNELQEMNKELERSNNELQQFAYVASHDLQEPLRKIITFSDSLERYKDNLPEKGQTYVEKIATSAERMTSLIDDLLNFSRISRSDEQFVSTDLNDSLKSVLSDFDLIINQKKALISKDKLPVVEAIPVQMKQLFHNLLSNALKFSKEGAAPEIKITARQLPKAEVEKLLVPDRSLDYIEILFKDNGIGFSADFSEQIFNVFQRLNASKDYPGTGIGLALCRKIVNNHGGEIHATSKENEGASFYVVLPVTQAHERNNNQKSIIGGR